MVMTLFVRNNEPERRHPAGWRGGILPPCTWQRLEAAGPAAWKAALQCSTRRWLDVGIVRCVVQRQGQEERGAAGGLVLEPDASVQCRGEVFGDGEAVAG